MMKTRLGIATIVLLFVSVIAPLSALELQDFNGQPASIEQYAGKGQWLVVMIWAHDCRVCNEEASNYDFFHDAYKDKNARVLGISIDGVEKKTLAEQFIARHQLGFPNLLGDNRQFMQFFNQISADFASKGWQGMPTPAFLIYNPAGKLVVQEVGGVPVNLVEAYIKNNSETVQGEN